MISSAATTKKPEASLDIGAMLRDGATFDGVIAEMRQSGFDRIDSILALKAAAGISFAAAKKAVHFSPVWADCLQSGNALHEAALAAAKEAGFADTIERDAGPSSTTL